MAFLTKLQLKRIRGFYTLFLTFVFLISYFFLDPDNKFVENLPIGSSSLLLILTMLKASAFVSFLHWARKAIFDYPEADLRSLIAKSAKTSQGSGLVVIGIGIFTFAFAMVIYASLQV